MPRTHKWCDALIIRVAAAFVRKLGLGAHDHVDNHLRSGPVVTVIHRRCLGGILVGLRRVRGWPPVGGRFRRREAPDRFPAAFKKARGTVDPRIDLGS